MLAEAAAGAGDDGDLAREIEEIVARNWIWHWRDFARVALGVLSWSQNHFQQTCFAGVKAFEPCGAVFERGNLRDERFHLDRAGREEFDGLRVFAGGGAGALEANLAADDFLEMNFYFGSEIADESDGAAFADGIDAVGDRFSAANGFEDDVHTVAVGEFQNLLREIRFRIENFSGAEIFRHF